MHNKLMQEQQRVAKSKASGEKKIANRRWLNSVGDLKGMKAEKSQGKKIKAIDETKNALINKLNEEVDNKVCMLSGGEKARLSLAIIAAKTPKLLILDEITNNIDLETKEHIIEVLKAYPGAIIIISHDVDFLKEIGIDEMVDVAGFNNH